MCFIMNNALLKEDEKLKFVYKEYFHTLLNKMILN
jgi:hypothetical protein